MRSALYIRVSTEEQGKEGFSIDAQKSLLLRKSDEANYTINDIYIDDGYSAKDMKRPQLQRVFEDIKKKKVDVVLFWRLDRLTRNSKNFQWMREFFEKNNAGFISATENIDTTSAQGRFVLELSVSLAQLERETTAERVYFAMEERHRQGLRNGAVAPFGYDIADGKLIINPLEAAVVRRIFDMYKDNHGGLAIAKQFNREKVPFKNKWNYTTIYYIVTNPVYIGKLRWNNRKASGKHTGNEIIIDSDHEPIVTEDEYNYVQHLRMRRNREGKVASSDYPFTGVLRCGRCGYAMIGGSRPTKAGRKRYYKCLGRFNYGVCNMPIIAEESITDAFLRTLEHDTDTFESLVVVTGEIAATEEETMIEQIQSELESIQKRKKKWQVAYANDVITLEELREHTSEDAHREEYLKKQLEELPQKEKSLWTKEEIMEQLRQVRQLWHVINSESAKKNFLNDAFEFIKINTDETEAKGGPGRRVEVEITDFKFKI